MINIHDQRECFFDNYLIDEAKTTAKFLLHHPEKKDIILVHDEAWEGDGCDFHNFFYDDEFGIYRMYYVAWNACKFLQGDPDYKVIRICYAESKDGINWIKPKLGLCEFKGSKENNIILDDKVCATFDNLFVFKDKNPNCKPDEKYKGIAKYGKSLYAFFSTDGIHFEVGREITSKGAFDSLNTMMWDETAGKYRGFLRGFHVVGDLDGKDPYDEKPLDISDEDRNERVRDVRYIESEDFITFSKPKLLNFIGKEDVPLYTNCVSQYKRAPHMMIGFPSRYVERKEWTKCYDELCGKKERLERMEIGKRLGLAVTDCVFMCSRDGVNFTRYDSAFIRPGAEYRMNWVYGSCYPTIGFVDTTSHVKDDCDKEMSFFCYENHWSGEGAELRRYTLRQDGFVSLHSEENEEIITTKPFVFEGTKLYANISTSAYGYVIFEISSKDGKSIKSCEMFGDSVDKLIGFDDTLSDFSGKEVVMTIKLLDADIYSIKFEK